MDSANALPDADLPTAEPPGRILLAECPQCGYPLFGLPASHRCPECGFAYDDRTFVLTGISRGMTGMRPGRKWLWLAVALSAWLGFFCMGLLFVVVRSVTSVLSAGAIWPIVVLYLILTGRRERQGVERFLCSAEGFSNCADLTPINVTHARIIPWSTVDAVIVDRKGPQWHRIRIGSRRLSDGGLTRVCLDLGVRCNEQTAEWVRQVLTERMAAARQAARPVVTDSPAG